MVAGSMVKEHPAALVECSKTNPVFLIHLLLFHRNVVPLAIPGAEPLRGVRIDDSVLVPHPKPKVFNRGQTSLVTGIFDVQLIVDLGQED